MADTFTKEQRSEIMRKVKSYHNKSTEMKVIEYFKENKIKGWRRNFKLYGKPDFVFSEQRIAIFIDGCFWHGHDCRNTKPKDNFEYWQTKIARNKQRDKIVTKMLITKKWTVIRIWECELKHEKTLKKKLKAVYV
ncbi:MAG TPA: very short patch repair endonuclease [Bacteroidota bacterium]|nr:very short patch repair endonuclease [Bacteroidota bacterium]